MYIKTIYKRQSRILNYTLREGEKEYAPGSIRWACNSHSIGITSNIPGHGYTDIDGKVEILALKKRLQIALENQETEIRIKGNRSYSLSVPISGTEAIKFILQVLIDIETKH